MTDVLQHCFYITYFLNSLDFFNLILSVAFSYVVLLTGILEDNCDCVILRVNDVSIFNLYSQIYISKYFNHIPASFNDIIGARGRCWLKDTKINNAPLRQKENKNSYRYRSGDSNIYYEPNDTKFVSAVKKTPLPVNCHLPWNYIS